MKTVRIVSIYSKMINHIYQFNYLVLKNNTILKKIKKNQNYYTSRNINNRTALLMKTTLGWLKISMTVFIRITVEFTLRAQVRDRLPSRSRVRSTETERQVVVVWCFLVAFHLMGCVVLSWRMPLAHPYRTLSRFEVFSLILLLFLGKKKRALKKRERKQQQQQKVPRRAQHPLSTHRLISVAKGFSRTTRPGSMCMEYLGKALIKV